jgi:hypothetical protein
MSWNCVPRNRPPFKRPWGKGCTKQTKFGRGYVFHGTVILSNGRREKAAQSKQNVRYAFHGTVFLSIAFKREKAAQSKQNVRYVCHGTVFLSIGRLSNGRGKKAAQFM